MESDIWALVMAFFGAMALAAALGLWHDLTRRPARARLLTLTNADRIRAKNMSNYCLSIRGTEW